MRVVSETEVEAEPDTRGAQAARTEEQRELLSESEEPKERRVRRAGHRAGPTPLRTPVRRRTPVNVE